MGTPGRGAGVAGAPRGVKALELEARLPPGCSLTDLSARTFDALAELGELRWIEDEESALAEGDLAESFFVLISGRVKMSRSLSNGRNLVLALFNPGDLFGTAAALAGQTCDASLVALERSLCLEIRRDDLFALFEEKPELVGEVLPLLSRQLVECKNCIVELMSYRVEIRLARLMVKLADSVGHRTEGGLFIPIPLSRQELADMVGTTIETSIRVMSRWGKEGLVATAADGFLVRDREALRQLSVIDPA